MIWIALSPVMIITQENSHSLYEYSLWQIPMFFSIYLANTLLQKWVEKFNLPELMKKGTYTVVVALILSIFMVQILMLPNMPYILALLFISWLCNRQALLFIDNYLVFLRFPKGQPQH